MLETAWSDRLLDPASFHPAISITEGGLVCGAGSILVRMAGAGGRPRLMVETDDRRLVAMLSVALNRRVLAAEIIPHVSAATQHWSRGDKAVANFRLTFARLPQLRDAVDAERLRLAEYLLDQGLPPDALMKELGFAAASSGVQKYREDQPRVPAGFGDQGGRWTSDPEFSHRYASPKSFRRKTRKITRPDTSKVQRLVRRISSMAEVGCSTRPACLVA